MPSVRREVSTKSEVRTTYLHTNSATARFWMIAGGGVLACVGVRCALAVGGP